MCTWSTLLCFVQCSEQLQNTWNVQHIDAEQLQLNCIARQVVVLTIEINLFPSACWITHTMPPCHMIIHSIPYMPQGFAHHTTWCACWIIRTIPHHITPHCMPVGSAATIPPYKSRPCLTTHCLATDAQFFIFTKIEHHRWSIVLIPSICPLLPLLKSDFLGVFKTSKSQMIA